MWPMMVTEADWPATPAAGQAGRLAALRARLASPMPDDRLWGWLGPLIVTAFGAFLRFYRLQVPRAIIFDETYYAKDAWSILQHGTEWNYVSNANTLILQGHTTGLWLPCSGSSCGEYVVQPEMGKLLIAVGEWLFGLNSFGWRFSSAVFGSLAILLMCRIARRMTRSTLLGCIAGLLMALDGLEFVLSRTGILDIFLMFFVLAAFGCILIDRDESRARLAEAVALGRCDEAGPRLGIRRWRVAAGIFLGLVVATKWTPWYIIGFAALGTAWDIGARRAAGLRSFVRGTVTRDVVWLPVTFLVIPLAVYVASWSDWFATSTGYDRNYAQLHGVTTPVISALYSLWEYHLQAFKFAFGLRTPHPYQSQPWDWLLITRPVAFFYECYTGPVAGPQHYCPSGYTGSEWSQEVLAIGTPAIWWGSILALAFCLGWWLLHRDWRAGAVLLGVVVGWGPWFPLVSRTKFYYYALEFEPFLILSIVLCLGLILGPAAAGVVRRSIGAGLVGAYVLCVLLMFWYFYAIFAAKVIPYPDWLSHMWYRIGKGWILPGRRSSASSKSALSMLAAPRGSIFTVGPPVRHGVETFRRDFRNTGVLPRAPRASIYSEMTTNRSRHEPSRTHKRGSRAIRARCRPAAWPAVSRRAPDDAEPHRRRGPGAGDVGQGVRGVRPVHAGHQPPGLAEQDPDHHLHQRVPQAAPRAAAGARR
jgi:dolichyl-phosphate-mannose-protein mannosyltransferase